MLNLKPNHKAIRAYYQDVETMMQAGARHEGAVAPAFAALLRHCARQFPQLKLVEQYSLPRDRRRSLRADGAIVDNFSLRLGVWEAKDSQDDLAKEIQKKFAEGYPKDNILFQSPEQLVLWQNGKEIFNADIRNSPEALIEGLQLFFGYQPPAYEQWQEAIAGFKEKVEELGLALLGILRQERTRNKLFTAAFEAFFKLCQDSINPNLSSAAVEEMLIQHLLTERIFRKVFNNPDFINKNIIAREIEQVITALTSRVFSREEFLKKLDHFYRAIEITAATIDDYAEKQSFLNAVYEQFFQGFAVKAADTHGIVYTPQLLVDFMVRSVDELLRREFNCSLSSNGVHILDPFVGTGNFIVRILREIDPAVLVYKYAQELHCNEIMLLPYYIASMNVEHAYYELVGEYQPFDGICLVDTFELAESRQHSFGFLIPENIARVTRQKDAAIFVIIGNPPYNAGQVNENDNNKNRKYPVVDQWVSEHYAMGSKATNKNALSDPYVKAFAWATLRLRNQARGIVAFVSNNSFLDGIAFDGMRKKLAADFASIYVLDLGGNVRKNPKLSGTTHNVFGIQVGVSITFLIRNTQEQQESKIYYARVGENWRKEQKYEFLKQHRHYQHIEWREILPNSAHLWLTEGLQADFGSFISLGNKDQKNDERKTENVIFKTFSNGVKTNRDAWTYNFNQDVLATNMQHIIEFYNGQVFKWSQLKEKPSIDDFVSYDDKKISWAESLKNNLQRGKIAEFNNNNTRVSIYRPFTKSNLYFDRMFNERVYIFPSIFPTTASEVENKVICLPSVGGRANYWCLCANLIPNLSIITVDANQCFPFYTYSEDGQHRQENLTDWALAVFREY
ncbi:MAG: type ISP restriction/modification enzyme, partial [Candidatus Competibacteraceae bacterium]